MMRALLWLAFLFAVATALAIVGHHDTGQVVIVFEPYRIDVSLNFFVIAVVVVFIVLYALLRALRNIWKMPERVSAYRTRSRTAKGQTALREAVGNLFAGRFSRAEKAARDASVLPENNDAASLIAATAAHRMHEFTRRDEWLAAIRAPEWQDARLSAQADMCADGRDPEGALAALTEMQAQGGRRIYAQQIALRAHQQLRHWAEVLRLVKGLEKRDAIHSAVAMRLRQLSGENLLRDCRHNADALMECWNSLPASERISPRLADLAAELLVALDRPAQARAIVEEALGHSWDTRLLRRYADCAGDDPLPLIARAEAWRVDHGEDPDLLFALGRLCLQQQLWGKSQAFLEQALKLTDDRTLTMRLHRTLAQLHEQLGNQDQAGQHYRAGALMI
ncbi:heme biosynthesis HemY N-terminal domain-containing protein [Burkholderia sp. L27(2015)]|uniref:heme biosynthesis HemY N-terminal domain-containing protein n=1 Tax=Burkholderia sp. L27(2015) TaxID=1641858 RepID=UPI00131B9687|nr:heme biosynthesis HemY N-terminal domain-containing protein [Burkholderia sp. L27(2015)]